MHLLHHLPPVVAAFIAPSSRAQLTIFYVVRPVEYIIGVALDTIVSEDPATSSRWTRKQQPQHVDTDNNLMSCLLIRPLTVRFCHVHPGSKSGTQLHDRRVLIVTHYHRLTQETD